MIRKVLKNKLVALGYAASYVENKINEFNISIDFSKYSESDLNDKVKVVEFDRPSSEIPKFFLDVRSEYKDRLLLEGNIRTFTKSSVIGSELSLADYAVCEKLCIIGITADADINILIYVPSKETMGRYRGKTYEELYAEDREEITMDYLEALTAGNRLSNQNAKNILYVLLTEFVIDTILFENSNPRLKLYDNPSKFADVITNYEFKYINRRINRIEYVEKYADVRFVGYGVTIGNISNEPYLLLKDVNKVADFQLNMPTYVWLKTNEKGQEEIAIYTSIEKYPQNSYKELVTSREDVEVRQEADRLTMQFSNTMGYQISSEYIFGVLKKLNKNLLIPPLDFIHANTDENIENIEPLRYRFTVIKNKKEFESKLYNAIEDNINGRYRYRFVEKLSGIYMTVGNKLNYTDPNGKYVRKQSVADFNINYNAAVVKRETIIDARAISQLMGFMYKDLNKIGTDMLPVPSIEVIFYFPEVTSIGGNVEMYNGTSVEIATGDGFTSYYDIGKSKSLQGYGVRPKDPNEKYVVVKYINSDGKILKENIIRDVIVGGTFVPELIPIITDKEGKEWICDPKQLLSLKVSSDNSKNEIEVRYIRKMAPVRINYINRQGTELRLPVMKNMQVGETFDINSAKTFVDTSKTEWFLYQSKPARFVVSEDENVLTLVYDVSRVDVYVYFKNRDNKEIKPAQKVVAVANKEFTPQFDEKITDSNGLLWKYSNNSKSTIMVKEYDTNSITLVYDELKKRVVTKFVDEKGMRIRDDIVSIEQVGKEISAEYENTFIDIYNKKWKFKSINNSKIRVSENEQNNVFTVIYEKALSIVVVSMKNGEDKKLKEDIIEKVQIGSVYKPTAIKYIETHDGKFWVCTEENKETIIDESEVKNKVSFRYKPLLTQVVVQYIDIEGNQLLPEKEYELQAGSTFIPECIGTLQGLDQRVWVVSQDSRKEYKVNKHKEENIIKINYEKKLVDVHIFFKDIHGNTIKSDMVKKVQLGSDFKYEGLEKITSENGEKWMITRSEPARMFVKENSAFTLIYDEIRAKVIVKHVNLNDSESFIDDEVYITKLGGVYVPNVQAKVVDKKKRRWVYAGEPAVSIVTKENEQENIILLKYEPDKANVTVKYINEKQQMIHKDVLNAEQIGSEVAIKEYDKITEKNGFAWKIKSMDRNTLIVDEDESKNIVVCTYEPLMAKVVTRYIDEQVNEITTSAIDNLQVGTKFKPAIIPKIEDSNGRAWVYSNIQVSEIVIEEKEINKVNIKYVPLKKNVTEKFANMDGTILGKEKIAQIQVGELYKLKRVERVIDSEGKSWIYKKSSTESLKVSEDEGKNIITNYYEKELTDVVIKSQTIKGDMLINDKTVSLQIGSMYHIEAKETLEDVNKLLWSISSNNQLDVKVSSKSSENTFTVQYVEYLANVYDKYIDVVTGEEIIHPTVSKHQVGSSYLVNVKDEIIDADGKHWVQSAKSDVKIFTSNYKVEPITVVKEEAKNVTIVKYKPKLVETVIRYQDSLGRQIKVEETKKLQVGSIFKEKIESKIVDSFGNRWTYNPHSVSDIRISENPDDNIIVLAYEEQKSTVTFKYLDRAGNELKEPTTRLVQIGSTYVPQFDTIITDSTGAVWEYAERSDEKIVIKEDDKENIVKLVYSPLNINTELTLVDLWGNEISGKKIVPAQLGSKYRPVLKKEYTNEKSLLYKLVNIKPESLVIKEIPIGALDNPNKFKLTFEPVMSDIVISFEDLNGNKLKDDEMVNLQVGSKYTAKPIDFIKDKKGNQWQLIDSKIEEVTVLENEKENVIKFVYEVAKSDIILRCVNVEGIAIRPEKIVTAQVGSEYVPTPEEYIYDSENKKWRLLRVQPVNLRVGSINNIVLISYQEEKTSVVWEYCSENGEMIRTREKHDVQIGTRYTPLVKNSVIYDSNQIWRLLRIEPNEIIISEKPEENVFRLIYTNDKIEIPKEENNEVINPFANTISEPAKVEVQNTNNMEKQVELNKQLDEDKEDNKSKEEEFEFKDPHLRRLLNSMVLSTQERITINTLNDINSQIMEEMNKAKNLYYQGQSNYDFSKVEQLIKEEKEKIKLNLDQLIEKDKSGTRMLKIFEHITASESDDVIFGKLQQRKAVLITDYFLDKVLDDMDKVMYICERGKNKVELELIEQKLQRGKLKGGVEIKVALQYEKILLDNYYKARNIANDTYFTDASVKQTTLPDIVVGVTNLLVNQALSLLAKDDLNIMQRNELEAIMRLCSPQQINSIKGEIENFGNRQKKNAGKMIQEILKNMK